MLLKTPEMPEKLDLAQEGANRCWGSPCWRLSDREVGALGVQGRSNNRSGGTTEEYEARYSAVDPDYARACQRTLTSLRMPETRGGVFS